jgi:hypothetical protein
MTAPFNPTELARKAADNPLLITLDYKGKEAKRAELERVLLAFARDLIAQSGAVEALEKAVVAHHFDGAWRPQAKSVLKSLRSITEAERGGNNL